MSDALRIYRTYPKHQKSQRKHPEKPQKQAVYIFKPLPQSGLNWIGMTMCTMSLTTEKQVVLGGYQW